MSIYTQAAEQTYKQDLAATGAALVFQPKGMHYMTLWCYGTFSAMSCAFEVSFNSTDGTDGTWLAVQATRNNSTTVESSTGSLSGAPAYFWEIDVSGAPWFRVRCTARTSGTQSWVCVARDSDVDATPVVQVAGTPNVSVTNTPNVAVTGLASGTAHYLISAASTNATSVRNAAASLMTMAVSNFGASTAYLKLFNKTSAPVLGTDSPTLIFAIPAGQTLALEFGAIGLRFSAGIAYGITAAAAPLDTTAIAASDVRLAMTTL